MPRNEPIRIVLQFAVTDVERLREMAGAMVEVSKTEPGTLMYDWYLDEANKVCTLTEAYESMDAITAHSAGPVFTELAPKYAGVVRPIKADVFGNTPAMQAAVGTVLGAETTWWGPTIAAV